MPLYGWGSAVQKATTPKKPKSVAAPAPPAPQWQPPDPNAGVDTSGSSGGGGGGGGRGLSSTQVDYYRTYLQNYLARLGLQQQGLGLQQTQAPITEKIKEQTAGRSATTRGAYATQGFRDQLSQLKQALQTQLAQYALRAQQLDLQKAAESARIGEVTKGAVGG